MSDYMEMIDLKTMTGKLLCNGELVAEYKVEQCDKCSQITKFDSFGYQKGTRKSFGFAVVVVENQAHSQ
jgi:hypothetical protein